MKKAARLMLFVLFVAYPAVMSPWIFMLCFKNIAPAYWFSVWFVAIFLFLGWLIYTAIYGKEE